MVTMTTTSFTIGTRVTGRTAEIIGAHAARLPHDLHCAYDHGDGMVPWCDECGTDESGRPPASKVIAERRAKRPGRHAAPEPGSIVTDAPARTMGTLAPLVATDGPLEENRTSVIDITDRIVTHEFPRPVIDARPRTVPFGESVTFAQSTGSHRAPVEQRPRWKRIGLNLFIAAALAVSAFGYVVEFTR